MITVKELEKISSRNPSQWKATDTEGRPVYIRYRNNQLYIEVGEKEGHIDDITLNSTDDELNMDKERLVDIEVDDEHEESYGKVTEETMIELLSEEGINFEQ